jgi:hypothetical protein
MVSRKLSAKELDARKYISADLEHEMLEFIKARESEGFGEVDNRDEMEGVVDAAYSIYYGLKERKKS